MSPEALAARYRRRIKAKEAFPRADSRRAAVDSFYLLKPADVWGLGCVAKCIESGQASSPYAEAVVREDADWYLDSHVRSGCPRPGVRPTSQEWAWDRLLDHACNRDARYRYTAKAWLGLLDQTVRDSQ